MSQTNLHYSIPAIITLTLFHAACSSVSPPDASLVNDFFPETTPPQATVPPQPPEEITDALIPDIHQTLSLPGTAQQPLKFDISVHEVAAREFFMGLVIDTDENMLVHPEVTGKISLELKNVTVTQVLEAVQKVYGYDYKKNDIGYIIYPATLQSKIFKIKRLDLIRKGQSRTRVSSGQISSKRNNNFIYNQAGNENNDQQNSEVSGSLITTKSETDFWQEIEQSLNSIVSINEQANIVVNRETGILVVRAKPMQMREVEKFIAATQLQVEKQVIIEAKILEVILNDSHQSGINWASIVKEGTKIFFSSGASLMADGASTLARQLATNISAAPELFTLGVQQGNFTAFVTLLETQGKTRILSSPRISTLNNQKAVIKVGRDEYFITDVSSNTVTSGSSTITNPDITWTPFFSGIALDVTPQINDNNEISLHIHPSITRVESQIKQFTINGEQGELPMALNTVRESDSIVRARNGQIIVIGGLMQETSDEDKRGVSFLTRIPYLGNLFRENASIARKTELVILLKPTIVIGNQVWNDDMYDSKKRMQQLENFEMWK